ncbi:fumarate hydratase class II [Oceaniferula spumae]|uniref:Fumarate hydratase class II n=1 Tax=Oceaniferula spumae TaxID=2979115 RepID=A0AAT9FJZ2_9BACT
MRKVHDSMGELELPDDTLYGASTQRAVDNFPVSGHRMPQLFIESLGQLKLVCAEVNFQLGLLDEERCELIKLAAMEVAEGKLMDHFPVDVFQTGSGTSTNMNANEVIATRAMQLSGTDIEIHPNDHVNLGQSSNDVMPTALHLSICQALDGHLKPALRQLNESLANKADEFWEVVKIGRTHTMDAVPITLGQEFSGYASQIAKAFSRVEMAVDALEELAIGGTAVGTGLNTHSDFAKNVVSTLNEVTRFNFRQADNHFEAQAGRDDVVEVAGYLNVIAASVTKIANDLRLLGSGPRSGLGEISLPAVQPGSSIMPGKVNPVMCEMMVQVGHYVQGLCVTVAGCGREGQFELNTTIPLLAYSLHEMINSLANGVKLFAEKCVDGIQVNAERCTELVQRSLMLVTALTPALGYERAAKVAKKAHVEGLSLKEVVLAEGLMSEAEVEEALDPTKMTKLAD